LASHIASLSLSFLLVLAGSRDGCEAVLESRVAGLDFEGLFDDDDDDEELLSSASGRFPMYIESAMKRGRTKLYVARVVDLLLLVLMV
jgi:hypothetical protein